MQASDAEKLAFANILIGRLSAEPITSISKSEIELLVFRALLAANIISLEQTHFEMATVTMLPKAKIENLLYRHRLTRRNSDEEFEEFSRHVCFVGINPDDGKAIISIEDKFFREMFEARLRRLNVFLEGSFKRDLLHVAIEDFERVIDSISKSASERFAAAKKIAIRKYRKDSTKEAIKEFITDVTRDSIAATLTSFMNPR